MDRLKQTQFFRYIVSGENNNISHNEIFHAFEQFTLAVTSIAEDPCLEYKQHFRTLSYIHAVLVANESHANLSPYITAAIHFINAELELLKFQPKLPLKPQARQQSQFNWSEKFTKRDLIELLTSLDQIGAIVDVNGKKISYSLLVETFEKMLNLELSKSYNIRTEVLSRKIKCTDFLNRLTKVVIEKSQK